MANFTEVPGIARYYFHAKFCNEEIIGSLSKHGVDGSKNVIRVSAIIFQLFKVIMLEKMFFNYPGIKLEPALGT